MAIPKAELYKITEAYEAMLTRYKDEMPDSVYNQKKQWQMGTKETW